MTGSHYDRLGVGYANIRQADPRIAARIDAALGDARTVVNVGAGSSSYEPAEREVTAVEPSTGMIAQRPAGAARVVQARAERLPFASKSFDAAMAVMTIHHWADLNAGIREMQRVARRRIVIVTFDLEPLRDLWILREYFPDIYCKVANAAIAGAGLIRNPATVIRAWAVWDLADKHWLSERIW